MQDLPGSPRSQTGGSSHPLYTCAVASGYQARKSVSCGGIGPTADTTVATVPSNRMAEASPWIAIVDDDPSVLKALSRLLRTHACHSKTYEPAQAFLKALPGGPPECLVVDWQNTKEAV